jgi:plasmid segregation protein ParM
MNVNMGLDVGFGDVKIVANIVDDEGRETIAHLKYPTAIAYAKDGIIGDLAEQEEYEFDGRTFVVGNTALQSQNVFATRGIEFLLTYSPLLAYKAMAGILQPASLRLPDLLSAKKRLCLGIPLAYYGKRHELQRRFSAYNVSGNTVEFDHIEVRAQAQGILFDYMLDEHGSPLIERVNQNVLVLDIGFNTVDVLAVIEGRPNREWSGMLENAGICRVCKDLKTYLQKELSFNLCEQVVKNALQKGRISLYGASRDLSTYIRKTTEAYSDWLSREVQSGWDAFIKRADRLIIAGGGAYYVHDLRRNYPERFVLVPDESEYSNAWGFLKFALGAHPAADI